MARWFEMGVRNLITGAHTVQKQWAPVRTVTRPFVLSAGNDWLDLEVEAVIPNECYVSRKRVEGVDRGAVLRRDHKAESGKKDGLQRWVCHDTVLLAERAYEHISRNIERDAEAVECAVDLIPDAIEMSWKLNRTDHLLTEQYQQLVDEIEANIKGPAGSLKDTAAEFIRRARDPFDRLNRLNSFRLASMHAAGCARLRVHIDRSSILHGLVDRDLVSLLKVRHNVHCTIQDVHLEAAEGERLCLKKPRTASARRTKTEQLEALRERFRTELLPQVRDIIVAPWCNRSLWHADNDIEAVILHLESMHVTQAAVVLQRLSNSTRMQGELEQPLDSLITRVSFLARDQEREPLHPDRVAWERASTDREINRFAGMIDDLRRADVEATFLKPVLADVGIHLQQAARAARDNPFRLDLMKENLETARGFI